MARTGQEARLCYLGHVLIENRHGIVVDGCVTHATGTTEREAAKAMAKEQRSRSGRRITLGADKGYDTKAHVAALREARITPHVARNTGNAADQTPQPPARRSRVPHQHDRLQPHALARIDTFTGEVRPETTQTSADGLKREKTGNQSQTATTSYRFSADC